MLNQSEFSKLQQQNISHMARTLYIFYLQPQYCQGANRIDCYELSSHLVSTSSLFPYSPTIQDIYKLLDELASEGLISKNNPNKEWNNNTYSLPLYIAATKEYPSKPFRMYQSWQPGPNLKQAALYAGLVDYSYTNNELNEFINYWMVNNTAKNQHAWERAFVQRLLKIHNARDISENQYAFERRQIKSLKGMVSGQRDYIPSVAQGYDQHGHMYKEYAYARSPNQSQYPEDLHTNNFFTNEHGFINEEQEFANSFSDFEPMSPQQKSVPSVFDLQHMKNSDFSPLNHKAINQNNQSDFYFSKEEIELFKEELKRNHNNLKNR